MHFEQIKEFLITKMRMSHIYQPVMIKKLLKNRGRCTDLEIAQDLLMFDPSQLEYYQSITNNMVGRVLKKHTVVSKINNFYELIDFNNLSQGQIAELISICEAKVDDYIRKRGDAIWKHRRMNRNHIPGTIRYEVLKRASFHCELCGISADERALEVDHIVPVSKGGDDSIFNYQALCYVCNASKRDRDDTDLRDKKKAFQHVSEDCIFCSIDKKRIVEENRLALIIEDKYPVTKGHSLVIPKRHFQNYFEATQPELNSIQALLLSRRDHLLNKDNTIQGFNVGINSGEVAGQTIYHTHIHLIPRRKDDVKEPRGGIRNIIPGKGLY